MEPPAVEMTVLESVIAAEAYNRYLSSRAYAVSRSLKRRTAHSRQRTNRDNLHPD
jgi:hypothetical protein